MKIINDGLDDNEFGFDEDDELDFDDDEECD